MRKASSLVLVLVALGCESLTAPTRTATYPLDLSGSGLTFSWPIERLPVRFYVPPDAGPTARFVSDGIVAWERQLLYGEFRGIVSTDSSTADVIVRVVGGAPPDVPLTDAAPVLNACGGRTGVDSLAGDQTIIGPLRMRIDWSEDADPADVANCLARVVTHEIGHSLGLFAHSADAIDIMNANPRVRTPSTNDRIALQILYHTPSDIRPPERSGP